MKPWRGPRLAAAVTRARAWPGVMRSVSTRIAATDFAPSSVGASRRSSSVIQAWSKVAIRRSWLSTARPSPGNSRTRQGDKAQGQQGVDRGGETGNGLRRVHVIQRCVHTFDSTLG